MINKTALIVPCYNEEHRLQREPFKIFVDNNPTIDIWFVDDGSKDNTFELITSISNERKGRIFVYKLEQNGGKGEAIRQGIKQVCTITNYTVVGFIDADLSAPLEEVIPLNSIIESDSKLLIVAGCRVKMAGRNIVRSLSRHYASRVFATYYTQLLNVHNYDTQCGLKLFKTTFAIDLFKDPFISRWLFDLEIFKKAKKLLGEAKYANQILEIPLYNWEEVGGSRLRLSDFLKAPLEVFKIRNHYQ